MLSLTMFLSCGPAPVPLDLYEGEAFRVGYPTGSSVEVLNRDAVRFSTIVPTYRYSEGRAVTVRSATAARFGATPEGQHTDGGSGGASYLLVTRHDTFEILVQQDCPEDACGWLATPWRALAALTRQVSATYRPAFLSFESTRHRPLLQAMADADQRSHTVRFEARDSREEAPVHTCTVAIDGAAWTSHCTAAYPTLPTWEEPSWGTLRQATADGRQRVWRESETVAWSDASGAQRLETKQGFEVDPSGGVTPRADVRRKRTDRLRPSVDVHWRVRDALTALGRTHARHLNNIRAVVPRADGLLEVQAEGHAGDRHALLVEPGSLVVLGHLPPTRFLSAGAVVPQRRAIRGSYTTTDASGVIHLLSVDDGIDEAWVASIRNTIETAVPDRTSRY